MNLLIHTENIKLDAAASDSGNGLMETLDGTPLEQVLIWIAIIFCVVMFLWGFFAFCGYIMRSVSKNKQGADSDTDNGEVKSTASEYISQAEAYDETIEDEEELIAVLAAAIAEFTGKKTSDFRVVSFKKRVK